MNDSFQKHLLPVLKVHQISHKMCAPLFMHKAKIHCHLVDLIFTSFSSQKESEMIYVNVSRVRDEVNRDEARLYNPFIITITSSPMHIIYPYTLEGVCGLFTAKLFSLFALGFSN